jgi:hypothetical protein
MGKIVWLASYPKSGNTWLRAFLHNYIAEPETPYSINRLVDFSASEANALFYQRYDKRPAATWSIADVQRMRPSVHRDLTRLHPDLVFVKTHNACLQVHDIPLCTPDATEAAIYILRDPRDIAISYSAYTGQSLDQIIAFMNKAQAANRGTAAQVFEFLGSWSSHVESWTRQNTRKTLILRYEDLLAHPLEHFAKVIDFLGGPPEPARLARAIEFSNFQTLASQEASQGYTANAPTANSPFFRIGQSGQWPSALSMTQRKQIEIDHQAVMQKFLYL